MHGVMLTICDVLIQVPKETGELHCLTFKHIADRRMTVTGAAPNLEMTAATPRTNAQGKRTKCSIGGYAFKKEKYLRGFYF